MEDTIVFFGSGPVAAESLKLLAKSFNIEAVITKPQPPHHREPFPVLVTAKELELKVFTPNGRQALSDLFSDKPVKSRLGVVIDYGFIINQDVLDFFPLGIINSHFSLLPEWRGADPISFTILSGQKQTGVSLMRIVAKMDEGPILAFGILDLTGYETTPELTSRLILLSDALLKDILPQYVSGQKKPVAQDMVIELMKQQAQPLILEKSYSRKLTKKDGLLDFTKPAIQLEREIRAFIEWPKSRTQLAGKDIVVTKATVIDRSGKSGSVVKEAKEIIILCADKALRVDRLKPSGKNEMPASAFLAGNKLN